MTRAAGDADLRGEQHPLPDGHAVGDLHQVVDLRAGADARLADGRPIDRRVRADLHVVFDDDVGALRNLQVRAVGLLARSRSRRCRSRRRPARRRGCRSCTRSRIDTCEWTHAVVADRRAGADDDVGVDDRARADRGARADRRRTGRSTTSGAERRRRARPSCADRRRGGGGARWRGGRPRARTPGTDCRCAAPAHGAPVVAPSSPTMTAEARVRRELRRGTSGWRERSDRPARPARCRRRDGCRSHLRQTSRRASACRRRRQRMRRRPGPLDPASMRHPHAQRSLRASSVSPIIAGFTPTVRRRDRKRPTAAAGSAARQSRRRAARACRGARRPASRARPGRHPARSVHATTLMPRRAPRHDRRCPITRKSDVVSEDVRARARRTPRRWR